MPEDLTQSKLIDCYGMTADEIARQRAEAESEGWEFVKEITTRDMGQRQHVNLIFTRDAEVELDPLIWNDKLKASPRGAIAYYLITIAILFSLFVLLHPRGRSVAVDSGVAIERRELVLPGEAVKAKNVQKADKRKRRALPAPKIQKRAEYDANGNMFRAEGGLMPR